jgi:hypothetical protein
MMAFIITGHTDEHGGGAIKPPVLVYDDGVTSVFVHPERAPVKDVKFYATQTEALAKVAALPEGSRMKVVEVSVALQGDQPVSYTPVLGGVELEVLSGEAPAAQEEIA